MEQRAYRIASIATSRHEDAMDILQDAMFTLAKRYADKTAEEWPGLFHRILQNRIRDWYRRQKVKNALFFWQPKAEHSSDDHVANTHVYNFEDNCESTEQQPHMELHNEQLGNAIDNALKSLPLRQQQTFLLRAWEGMNVKQTADILEISEGSVKTHYSRALDTLKKLLGEYSEEFNPYEQ